MYYGTSPEVLAASRHMLRFPIREVRVDVGTEFPLAFALAVQEAGMRLRHIKPSRLEQNGDMECSHHFDEEEFGSSTTLDGFASATQALCTWEHRYNHDRSMA